MTTSKTGPVVVFGDIIIDHYLHSYGDKIDQTSPVPYGELAGEHFALGGAGNTALNIAALGMDVVLVGMQDESCDVSTLFDQHQARRNSRACHDLAMSMSHKMPIKHRLMDMNHRLLARWDDPYEAIDEDARNELLIEQLREAMEREPSMLVVSDYNKGALTDATCAELSSMRTQLKCDLIVDPHETNTYSYLRYFIQPSTLHAIRHQTVFMPNKAAYKKMMAIQPPVEWGSVRMVITDSAHGLSVAWPNAVRAISVPAIKVTQVDSCGASDAVAAGLAYGLSHTYYRAYPRRLGDVAATMGGLAVTKPGTEVVWEYELRRVLHKNQKCVELPFALRLLKSARLAGQTISVTNGVFDLLHAGHRKLLQAAGKDKYLIAMVNDDVSAHKCKGAGRPVQPLPDRVAALTACPDVDLVVAFTDDTPADAIQQIAPDELWKDSRRKGEDIPGAAAADVVKFVEPTEHSTTALVDRMRP